ncbi:MAG: DNA repair protein RecN [Firmicutes bacterium]|nr:DNA repair protein RecN [Bacillota bacterium]
MLAELYVENFALIEQSRVQLGEGLNAITGETGAGKSLMIDAVSLLIGGRGGDGFIRDGCDRSLIEGSFFAPYPAEAQELLLAAGADVEDTVILSRELVRGGRNICRLNGRTVTLAQLRQLGRMLINIHGQMEHMSLLEEDKQLQLLDNFGGEALLGAKQHTAAAYARLDAARKALDDYEKNGAAREQRIDWLAFQCEELKKARLVAGEEEQLMAESRRLASSEKLTALSDEVVSALSDQACTQLRLAALSLKQAAAMDEQLQELADRADSLYYEADDIAMEVSRYRDSIGGDSRRQDEVESRLAQLQRLRKKYQKSIDDLIAYRKEAEQELQELRDLSESSAQLEEELAAAEAAYAAQAKQLSALRAAAAERLSAAITAELVQLCMPHAQFRVDLPPTAPSRHGNERAQFMICPNPGEGFEPVSKTASGGELSRIVLRMKVVLSQLDQVPTLVFDEVDSGLGGRALSAVAERLALVGRTTQAICVSHAALLAAKAADQIHISKAVESGRTVSRARRISGEERVEEIARMIAGAEITDITIAQAREMLLEA